MTAPVTFPSARQFVGMALETTPGTAVAPTFTLPVKDFKPSDKPTWLEDAALRGSMVDVYGLQQGPVYTEFDISGPVFGDGIGFPLANLLGDVTTTGAAAPFSHAVSTLNSGSAQPKTLTLTDWQGPGTNKARQYPGACFSELNFTWNAESALFEWDGKGSAFPSVPAAAEPTSAPTTVTPIASWRTLIGIAGPASGGTQVKTVADGKISIKRTLQVVYTASGTQAPYVIQRGMVAVDGTLNFVAADDSPLTAMLTNAQPALQVVIGNGGTGAGLVSVQFDLAKAAYTAADIDRGKAAVQWAVTFRGLATTTNAGTSGGHSAIKATVQNAMPAATYA